MNYKIATTIVGLAALIIPAGLALAKDGGQGSWIPGVEVAEHAQAGLNLGLGIRADIDDDSTTTADIEKDEHRSATSTERNKGQRGEVEREKHATSTASTTKDHEGFGKGGLVGFFRWLFGLPATTTVGDIRAEITATTTASTTTSGSQGLGFWAHILGFLHLR